MFSYDSFFGQDHPRLHLDGSKPPLPGLRNGLQHERKQLDIFRSNSIIFSQRAWFGGDFMSIIGECECR